MATNEKIELVSSQDSPTGVAGRKVNGVFQSNILRSSDLTPQTEIVPTQPKPATTADALQGQLSALTDQTDSFLKAQQGRADQSEVNKDSSLQDYINAQLGQTGVEGLTLQQEELANVPELETDLDRINTEMMQEQRALELQLRALDKNPRGLFGGALEQEKAKAVRESLQKQADLAIVQMAAQGRYDSAVRLADRRAKMLYEQEQNILDAAKTTYEDYKEIFNIEGSRNYELQLSERQRVLDQQREDEQTLQAAKLNAMQFLSINNQPASKLQAVQSAENIYDLYATAGKEGFVDMLSREALSLANEQTRLNLQQTRNEINDVNSKYEGEFKDVVDLTALLVGAERGQYTRKAMEARLESGDYLGAVALMENNVEESLTGEAKGRFANARTDRGVMEGMRDAIKAYEEAGGDMSILKGKAEDISRKIGFASQDPEFTALAVQLEREFQTYRNIMTGAAFTPGESREYEKVNPTSGKTLDLNLRVIDGALAALDNRVTKTVTQRVPAAQSLYDVVGGGGVSEQTTYKVSDEQINDDWEFYQETINKSSTPSVQ